VLRQAIEQAGLGDSTAILVSADHGWRTHMWRGDAEWTAEEETASHNETSGVPFLLKLPGQRAEAPYSKPFDTVVTRGIITSILDGRLTNPNGIPDSIESSKSGLLKQSDSSSPQISDKNTPSPRSYVPALSFHPFGHRLWVLFNFNNLFSDVAFAWQV
jgi:hypothetical protein